MEQDDKLAILAEIFDCDVSTLTPTTPLDTIGWDSMAMLSLVAIVRARFGRRLPGAQLRAFRTVQDILDAMQE